MNLDWSKAPKGATHYNIENKDFYASWYKVVDGEITHYNEFGDMWIPVSDSCVFPKVSDLQAIASRWNGEGLPPVGTVCEWHPSIHGWVEVTILGRDGEDTWYRVKGEQHSQTCANMTFFRPILTPEQIAAEERAAAVSAILSDAGVTGSAFADDPEALAWAEALYDTGYRKQVQP